ncbi:hypothetical protein B7C42_00238 [Nocardia cerradoensis]|uniref:Uncharacterized protein n=1 Tax=Nocardia cerradoensis TaxID=85688 RepID=A0A231HEB7_9NOCA|nr:hypothetical protein [Nocardia cerradoensis]OXR47116.1 hypothetical protein B7C42_00238 [Nocardia cerradoensis]
MQDHLERINKLQTIIVAIVVAGGGVALMVFGKQLPSLPNLVWLNFFPWTEVGGTLLVAGVLGLGIDYFTGKDRDERDTARLKRVLADSAPAMRDAVIDGFAFGNQDLARVASPETLDDIIRNSLALRLGDETFADEVYQDVRDQAVRAPERWHDATVEIRLTPLPGISRTSTQDAHAEPAGSNLFGVSVRWEYSVVPKHHSRHFAVVANRREYLDLTNGHDGTSAWVLVPKPGVDPTKPAAFELVQFSVDGNDRPIRRAGRKGGQVYSVDLGLDARQAEQPVTVAYTYRTVTEQRGNLLYIDIEQPTRGITVELDYSDCDIERIRVLDFIASSRTARIERSPDPVPGKTVRVGFDGWAFPRSGVGFVWTLNQDPSGSTGRNSELTKTLID